MLRIKIQFAKGLVFLAVSVSSIATAEFSESDVPTQFVIANRQLLLEVTSDATPGLDNKLTLLTNDANEILGLHFTDGVTAAANYSLNDLRDRIVLYRQSRFGITKDINYIHADRFDSKKGGYIELTLLREFRSIFSFDYRIARMLVSKNEKGNWQLTFEDLGRSFVFDAMFFKGYKKDGEFVGTEAITFIRTQAPIFRVDTRELRED